MALNKNKKYTVTCVDGAFDKDIQKSGISGEIRPYDAKMAEMTKCIEELDRYDDFAALKIEPEVYEKSGDGEYGIKRSHVHSSVNSPQVILRHQQLAAAQFLKELRGFGLLADVVGSGKTFEACTVLSELAVRGKMKSLLVVVPAQVYDDWIEVLEKKFGLGKGVLMSVKNPDFGECEHLRESGFIRPKRPVIVKAEDFAEWKESAIKNVLFDVVVVDEAHHLCSEEGRYAKAMKLLSLMMVTKKKANSTYCILLSATPHSGNLDKMFRLWYFIRCKGGNPDDFDEKDDKDRTADYAKEKKYYKENVCRGADTVAEFITAVKKYEIDNNYSEQFAQYLKSKKEEENFANGTEGEKQILREDFLKDNGYIRADILKRVASAYHNGVLRTIMIRQPNELSKTRYVFNRYFFPLKNDVPRVIQVQFDKGVNAEVDLQEINSDGAVRADGKVYSLRDYAEMTDKTGRVQERYAELLVPAILGATGSFADKSIFDKKNSLRYYWQQFARKSAAESDNVFRFMPATGDSYAYKLAELKYLLSQHAGERVLVFFDYDLPRTSRGYRQWEKVEADLLADEKFAGRIIIGREDEKQKAISDFAKREDAVLVVEDSAFTEGVNLQDSRIIINFQVTPDPLAMDQRIGRIFRLGQANDVAIYSFADMNKLEGFALAYFNTIGLLSSNSGDATIIAGSNNERMVALRCPACGKVALYSKQEYEYRKRKGLLYCFAKKQCIQDDPKGTLMEEINVYEFKCSTCDTVFARSIGDGGYKCISKTEGERGTMCNSGDKGDRDYYCSKLCAMLHCSRFKSEMDGKCAVINAYRHNPHTTAVELATLCANCKYKAGCPAKCRFGTDKESIAQCSVCDYSECSPKPHVISFDEKWAARCPKCEDEGNKGYLRPVVARTFAAYIRAAWEFKHDNGESFCANLEKEADKVADIREMLSMDR